MQTERCGAMYNGIKKIEEVIEAIEQNITSEVDCDALAAKMNLSVYEFRRIFSFIIGCPISEYVRRRRLSLAACEIMANDKSDLTLLSEKYGYQTQSAFSKAFKEQHGVSPASYKKGECEINLFTRPEFTFNVGGRENVSFKIINSDDFFVSGYSAVSDITDTCCCENVWNAFYDSGTDGKIAQDKIYAAYLNQGGNVKCTIGAKTEFAENGLDFQKIEQSRWAAFRLNTVDDDLVNQMYGKILYQWLPSAKLKRKENMPTVEVYHFDMSGDNFEWEIRIPIE